MRLQQVVMEGRDDRRVIRFRVFVIPCEGDGFVGQDLVMDLGMGKGELTSQVLMQCVAAVAGIEATRQLDDPGCKDSLSQALEATSSALRSALVFLERDARIPHLKLLPVFPLSSLQTIAPR